MGILCTADDAISIDGKKVKMGVRIELNAYVSVGQTDERGNCIWTSVGPFHTSTKLANEIILAEKNLWQDIVESGISACNEISRNGGNCGNAKVTAVGIAGYWEKAHPKPPYFLRGPGHVYIFKVEGHDLFKVGATKKSSHEGRLSSINTASPFDVNLYREYKVSNMRKVEELAHAKLIEFRTNREWFNCPADVVVDAVEWAMNKVCLEP